MLDRDEILHRIDEAYAARARGDKAEVERLWAPGATFRLPGEKALLEPFPTGLSAVATVNDLIDLITFLDFERLDAVVEGRKAAVHWRVKLVMGHRKPVTTELYDLWSFDEDGRVTSLLQFCDTALVASMID
jgi:ketosteroid isomerase-like protein